MQDIKISFKPLLEHAQIKTGLVNKLNKIINDYRLSNKKYLLFIFILDGSLVFASQIIDHLINKHDIILLKNTLYTTIKIKSYTGTEQGTLNVVNELDKTIEDILQDSFIVLVDDINDTGNTLRLVHDTLVNNYEIKPEYISDLIMLDKDVPNKSYQAKNVVENIDNLFVIGYGLDYNNFYRLLPYVTYVVEDPDALG